MYRKIAVVMGSDSDLEITEAMSPILRKNEVGYEYRIISAHRTPQIATEFAQNAKACGHDLIIAAAGMSAHLPGVLAAFTGVPVIGVPIKSDSSGMHGMDALHSIIQMPPGIPVATVGINHAAGAAKLAVKMINCFGKVNRNNHAGAAVKIAYSSKEVSEANLRKVTDALDIYGIGHIVADLTEAKVYELNEALNLSNDDNTFLILNLTGVNIEPVIENSEHAKGTPLVEVPLKALFEGINATSDKVYYQTGNSDSAAFVGVNSFQNAAHLIARIAGIHDRAIYDKVVGEHAKLADAVIKKDEKIRNLFLFGG